MHGCRKLTLPLAVKRVAVQKLEGLQTLRQLVNNGSRAVCAERVDTWGAGLETGSGEHLAACANNTNRLAPMVAILHDLERSAGREESGAPA